MLRNESKIHYRGSCHSTIHTACSRDISGGYSDGVPPLPIPNREVKPDRADGTAHPRESRSPPFYNKPRDSKETRGFVVFRRLENKCDGGVVEFVWAGTIQPTRGVCFGMRGQSEAWLLRENLYFREEIFCRSFTSPAVFILFLKCIHDIFVVFPSFS